MTETDRADDEHAHPPAFATLESVGVTATVKDGASEDERAAAEDFIARANEYFAHFVAPIQEERDGKPDSLGEKCFHCGEYLTGMGAVMLSRGGGFRWGLAHGEGFCGNCRWPARGHHFAKDKDGKELFTLRGRVLSYHPSVVERLKAIAEIDQ